MGTIRNEMTINELYQSIVNEIAEFDKAIEYMKGKREALNGVRLDLFQMLNESEDNNEP